jgi:DNA-binding response OmpR family regulator
MDGRPTVLVVDDEEDIVALMRDFLEADGYGVLVAHDGAAALAIIASTPPDCVLLDVMMPGQSGFDVVRKVRETSDVPILFLSARQEDSDKIRGLGLGADDYIVKSATPAEIVARVRAVLRRYRRGRPRPPCYSISVASSSICAPARCASRVVPSPAPPASSICCSSSPSIRARSSRANNSSSVSGAAMAIVTP